MGFGVLKLGKFWANWGEFVYSVSATLASFLFPKWTKCIPASRPLSLLLPLPGICFQLLFPVTKGYWCPACVWSAVLNTTYQEQSENSNHPLHIMRLIFSTPLCPLEFQNLYGLVIFIFCGSERHIFPQGSGRALTVSDINNNLKEDHVLNPRIMI